MVVLGHGFSNNLQDISEHWVTKLSMCPFLPNDNVGPVELPPEVDVNERLQYLQLLNSQLEQLLRMSFHVFWSQVCTAPTKSGT
eukprot:5863333-Amphidinium_carterae.1